MHKQENCRKGLYLHLFPRPKISDGLNSIPRVFVIVSLFSNLSPTDNEVPSRRANSDSAKTAYDLNHNYKDVCQKSVFSNKVLFESKYKPATQPNSPSEFILSSALRVFDL